MKYFQTTSDMRSFQFSVFSRKFNLSQIKRYLISNIVTFVYAYLAGYQMTYHLGS